MAEEKKDQVEEKDQAYVQCAITGEMIPYDPGMYEAGQTGEPTKQELIDNEGIIEDEEEDGSVPGREDVEYDDGYGDEDEEEGDTPFNALSGDAFQASSSNTIKVYIDPGHGGRDPGAQANGLVEKVEVLKIALRMEQILLREYENVEVRLSRRTDTFVTLEGRANDAKNWGANCFVSVHLNAFTSSANGIETFGHTDSNVMSLRNNLHSAMRAELNKIGTITNRGVKRANFSVLRNTYRQMRTALTEALFLTNSRDAQLMKHPQAVEAIARGHVNGIVAEYDLKRKRTTSGSSLQEGDRGEAVEQLQRNLNVLGFNVGSPDGIFGPMTRRGVEQFQLKHGISSSTGNFFGVAGPQTLAEIQNQLNTQDAGKLAVVIAETVNYRSRPSFDSSAIAGQARRDEAFTIVRRVNVEGSNTDMFELKSGRFITAHPNFIEVR